MKYLGPFLVGSAITVGAFYAASVTLTPLEDPRPPEVQEADALMFAPQPMASAGRKPVEAAPSSDVRTVALQNPVPSTMIQPDPTRSEPAPLGPTGAESPGAAEASRSAAPTALDAVAPETVASLPAEAPAAKPALETEVATALAPEVPLPKPASRPEAEPVALAAADEGPAAPDVDARFDSTEDIWAQKEDPALAALVKAKAAPIAGVAPGNSADDAGLPTEDPLAAMIASAGEELPSMPAAGDPTQPVEPMATLPAETPDPVAAAVTPPAQTSDAPAPTTLAEAAPVPSAPEAPASAASPEPEATEVALTRPIAALDGGETGSAGPDEASSASQPAGAGEALATVEEPQDEPPAAAPAAESPAATDVAASAVAPGPASPAEAPEPGVSSGEQMAAIRTPSAGSLTPEPAKPSPALNPGELQLTNVVVLDAGGFRAVDSSQGLLVRIADVEPLPFNRMCKDAATGRAWPCGAHARAALSKHIAGRTVACRERQATRKGQIREIRAACTVDGEDVARWLVASGWAEALSGDAALVAAADDARRSGRGQFAAAPSN